MARFGSIEPFPFHEGGPKSPHTFVVTISTANPHAAQRLREVFESTAAVDLDNGDQPWETYVEITQVDANLRDPKHVWSSAYEPDDED